MTDFALVGWITHTRGVNPTGQPPRGTPWVMLMPAVL